MSHKITSEEKHALHNSGRDNFDALTIVNAFYRNPIDASHDVFDEYWQHKVCILAERIVKAEKELADLLALQPKIV